MEERKRKNNVNFQGLTPSHSDDIFWLKDESLEDSASLPAPDILAKDIAENLESALGQFSNIHGDLERS
ncbi:MAG: hypothetical protein AB1478_01895 [Nitrospirota bacterium]